MPSKGFGSMFNSGPAFDVVNSAKKAQEIGRQMVHGTGPVGVTMKTLGLWDHFQEISEDIEKLEKMEKRLHERLDLAEKSLENARRSPYLINVGSVDLLEGTVVDSRKYLNYVGSCGPLLRGAAHDEMIAKLGNMLIWVTDSLVALQLDTMLAVTNGDVNSNVQQVAPEGNHPGDGGAPGQGVGPENQGGRDMTGQHPQQVLIPPPTHPELPHPHLDPQRMAPTGNMLGMPQIPPGSIVHTASRVTGAFAMPNGGAGWPNNAQGGPSMMMHQPPPMASGPPIAYGGIGWPNNLGTVYWMRPHTPSTSGVHPGFNRDLSFTATPHPPSVDAGRENSRAMWPNHGDPSSFLSLPATESVGYDGPTSPVPSDASSETARKVAWVDADSASLPHPAFSTSQDAKPNDEERQSDGPDTRSPNFDPAFHMKHQTRPVPYDQDAQLPHPPDTSSQVPHIVHDNIGRLYYVDPNTGHRYPAGWGHHPHIR